MLIEYLIRKSEIHILVLIQIQCYRLILGPEMTDRAI